MNVKIEWGVRGAVLTALTLGGPGAALAQQAPAGAMTLPEVVRTALDRSREIQQARYALDEAEEQVSAAWGSVYPVVELSANYTRNLGEFKRSSQHLEEELRWRRSGAEERIEFYVDGCVHQAVRRWDAASIGRGSGKRSLEVCRARRPPWRQVCPPLSGHAGFANVVACHPSIFVPSRGAISRSLSEKRSPFFEPVVVAYARSPGSWAAHPRRSRENCGGTQLQEEGTSSIGPRPLNGTPIGERNVQSLRSSLRTAN